MWCNESTISMFGGFTSLIMVFILNCGITYFDSTSFLQYTVIGGSFSYGDRLLVLRSPSRSLGFRRKSVIARTGVIKLRSVEEAVRSTRTRFLPGNTKRSQSKNTNTFSYYIILNISGADYKEYVDSK